MIDRGILLNAFQPAAEVDDPERFAGRGQQVRQLADSLHSNGSVPLIFGDRGLGKSSLALQVRRIAMGDVELLAHLKAERLALPEASAYLTFAVTCTDSTQTFADLLQALVNAAESIDNVPDSKTVGTSQLVDRTTRKKLTLKVFEFESSKKYQVESARLSYQDLNLEEKLVQLCELLTATYGQPVLFVIDEIDRMGDTTGLASFLKAFSSQYLKFLLVGIAGSVADLLGDHQSLERRLIPVRVPLMTQVELGQIVTKAQSYLGANQIDITFSERAIIALARIAAGFPWFVHVLGQQALVDADARGDTMIHTQDISRAASSIVSNTFAQQFSDIYQMAVRDSSRRETVLRAFARWTDADIPTGEVYRVLERLGVDGGSTYRSHLCRPEHGSVLFVPTFQRRGLVRFRNEMFKAYVRMRPSIYEGVAEQVDLAWDQR
ncbi:AAA family ATPase [Cellulomonas cellasea]|uniref:AAA family ATPase n=1 Tax=Cellulomonas cellasea TaxID=43670 RepID=UPI0025A472A0|nr:AAA family ATPase [Cellulomonas cellasea]MDM8083786.1 AAA family ATPase [Cellulomonas cellasea]